MELLTGKQGASLVVLYCIYGSDYNEAVHPTVQLASYSDQAAALETDRLAGFSCKC